MSRPRPTLAAALADVSRTLPDTRPEWLPSPAWRSLLAARRGAREALAAHVEDVGPVAVAEELGVARSTLALWLAAGGWLSRD